jgi:hypothetical protein
MYQVSTSTITITITITTLLTRDSDITYILHIYILHIITIDDLLYLYQHQQSRRLVL